MITKEPMPELKPCPFDAALWKGEPCSNPEKGWINDSRGNRITRLGSRNAFGKLIEAHNREIEFLKGKLSRAASVPSDKDVADIVDKAYIFLCNKLNDYQAKDSSRPASFYTDLKPSMLWAVEYLAKEGYIKTAPDQSDTIKAIKAMKEALERAKSRFNLMSGCERNGATAIAGYNDAEQALAILDRKLNGGAG